MRKAALKARHVAVRRDGDARKAAHGKQAVALKRARAEAKEATRREAATAEILKIIADSPSDAQPVFDAIVKSAARLFNRRAVLRVIVGQELHCRAHSGNVT